MDPGAMDPVAFWALLAQAAYKVVIYSVYKNV